MNRDNTNNLYKGIILKLYAFAMSEGGSAKRLPPLRTLAEQFHCTHPTVLRAVRELMEKGILLSLKGGGYMTVPQDTGGELKNVGYIYGQGMNLLDSEYSLKLKYHALNKLSETEFCLNFSEIKSETHGDTGRSIRSGVYSGIVLCAPSKNGIIPEVTSACRDLGIPAGVFGGSDQAGDVSVTYDAMGNYSQVFEYLLQKNRRKVLVLSCPCNGLNTEVKKALEQKEKEFEKALFMEDSSSILTEYLLQNVGGKGEDFDSVVYVMNIFSTYSRLLAAAPECFCVMPEFGSIFEKDFRGLVVKFDLMEAGRRFGTAMSEAMNGVTPAEPHSFIPCTFREVI